MAQNLIQKN